MEFDALVKEWDSIQYVNKNNNRICYKSSPSSFSASWSKIIEIHKAILSDIPVIRLS